MTDDDPKFARELLAKAYWAVAYHETALPKAVRTLKLVREFLSRTGFDVTDEDADDVAEKEPEDCDTVDEIAAHMLGSALSSIRFHEAELIKAERHVGGIRALLIRAGQDADIEAIAAEAYRKAREP